MYINGLGRTPVFEDDADNEDDRPAGVGKEEGDDFVVNPVVELDETPTEVKSMTRS
jgi:hypothetical protein